MTMRYTHIGLDDRAKAVSFLPKPTGGEQPSKNALHERCNSGGSKARRLSSDGREPSNESSHNPINSNSYGKQCRQMASSDKAEGMGLEPTTGCPAPEFQSGR